MELCNDVPGVDTRCSRTCAREKESERVNLLTQTPVNTAGTGDSREEKGRVSKRKKAGQSEAELEI